MKIDDQEIENSDVTVILEKLKELPPSLPELAEINKSKNIALSEEDMELWQKRDDVLDLLEVVEGHSQSEIFNKACQLEILYNKLIECTKQNLLFTTATETNCLAIKQSDVIILLVELKRYMGLAYSFIKKYTEAIDSYQEAIDLSLEYPQKLLYHLQTDIESICDRLIKCHENAGTLDQLIQKSVEKLQTTCLPQEELKIRYCLGAAAYAKKDYNAIIENYNKILLLKPNLTDSSALVVGQREVGFSSIQKIGTYNLKQCVAIIIHDPFSKDTALVHFDRYTSNAALDKVLNRFKSSDTLNVYLIGARDVGTNKNDSTGNIERIISILQEYDHINIKLADLECLGYEELVFDPMTAKITPAFPMAACPSISNSIVMFHLRTPLDDDFQQDIYVAFDLINSLSISNVIDFTSQEIKSIMTYYINYNIGIKNGILTDIASNRQAFAEVLGNKILKDNEKLTSDFIQLRVEKILQEDTTCNKKLVDDITNRAIKQGVYPPLNQEKFLQLDVIIQEEIDQVILLGYTSANSLDLVS